MATGKVIARIKGGLGNQLFIYAAARRLALANNCELVLDQITGFTYDTQYQRHYQLEHFSISSRLASASERMEPFSRLRRHLVRRWNQCLPIEYRYYYQQIGVDFDGELLTFRPHNLVYLEGYWQSESYFKDIESVIRSDLQITPPSDLLNHEIARNICSRHAVAVHVRFFDEPGHLGTNNASRDYYAGAIRVMEDMVSNAHYFIFSDRPNEARAMIPLRDEKITIVSHNIGDKVAYADLWLMSQCKHFIIANSTFSWWGAWLSLSPGKKVIAPGIVIRDGQTSWGFEGLLPNSWIRL